MNGLKYLDKKQGWPDLNIVRNKAGRLHWESGEVAVSLFNERNWVPDSGCRDRTKTPGWDITRAV